MTTARLLDGREVPSDSDEWRHECEARAINDLRSLSDRRAWLERIELRRGKDAAERLRRTMSDLWKLRP